MHTRIIFVALACGLAAVPAYAQTRELRSVTGSYQAAVTVRLAKDDTQIVIDRHVDGSQSTVAVPIRRPGQLVLLDSLGDGFVVTGSDVAGTGIVCLLRHSPSTGVYALADVYSAAGSDFVGVGYAAAAQRLYLLDSAAGKLLRAPFAGGATLPTTWTQLVSQATEPALVQLDARELVVDETTPSTPRIHLNIQSPTFDPTDIEDPIVVKDLATGPVLEVVTEASGRMAQIAHGPLLAGQTAVSVRGPANTAVSVLRVDTPTGVPTVLGTATTGGTGAGSVPVPALQLGAVYAAQTATWPWTYERGHVRYPEVRIGSPMTLPDGVTVKPGGSGGTIFIDNPYFGFVAELWQPQAGPLPVPRSYDEVVFILGTSASPIGSWNGKPVLLGDLFLSTTAKMSSKLSPGAANVDAPIPNDPNFAGVVLLHQWVFTVSGTTDVTEIVGAPIRPFSWVSLDEQASAAASGGTQTIASNVQQAQASAPTAAQRERARDDWFRYLAGKRGFQRFTTAEQQRLFGRQR